METVELFFITLGLLAAITATFKYIHSIAQDRLSDLELQTKIMQKEITRIMHDCEMIEAGMATSRKFQKKMHQLLSLAQTVSIPYNEFESILNYQVLHEKAKVIEVSRAMALSYYINCFQSNIYTTELIKWHDCEIIINDELKSRQFNILEK
jgi:hypothetical protein